MPPGGKRQEVATGRMGNGRLAGRNPAMPMFVVDRLAWFRKGRVSECPNGHGN